jgi:hypothetical protein
MKIETKAYPKESEEIVINSVKLTYSQKNENISDLDDELKLSIAHQGAGFYFVMKTKRWAFNSIDELIKTLEDFKTKSGVE